MDMPSGRGYRLEHFVKTIEQLINRVIATP